MTHVSGSTVERHVVWVCAGCEVCREPSTDGVTPGAPIPHDTPCTDTSPSMNGMVVVSAENYDRLWLAANSARVLIERHRATRGSNDLLTTALREIDEALDV